MVDLTDSSPSYENITVGNPSLVTLSHLHYPYKPFQFLSQTYCQALHRGKYTLRIHQKQNKEKTGPEDAIKAYIELKHMGDVQYSYMCTCSGIQKAKTKLAFGILVQMYGPNTKWKDLCDKMTHDILEAREKRGAGDKPVLRKYDLNNTEYFQ
jgi:hypothetical protein